MKDAVTYHANKSEKFEFPPKSFIFKNTLSIEVDKQYVID